MKWKYTTRCTSIKYWYNIVTMPQYPYEISIGSFVDFQTALINNTPPIADECFKLNSQYDIWISAEAQ